MAVGIRKCLDLGAAIENPSQHLSNPTTLSRVMSTGTKWIRCWISWRRAMTSPGVYYGPYINLVDSQIAIARANGMNVVLVTHEFPQWANGTTGVDPNTYAFNDRNQAAPGEPANLKSLTLGVPVGQLGTSGYWGQWIHFLIARYRPATNVVLEIMNEPNFEWWPQLNSSGTLVSPCYAAEMMHTAAMINAFYGMGLAAPAVSDTRINRPRAFTLPSAFLGSLKIQLQNLNWNGTPQFVWSHHNYADIETQTHDGYNAVYNTLTGWWQGWKAPGNHPGIWMTEGGCRRGRAGGNLTVQADRVWNHYQVMRVTERVSMFTNYLLHTASDFDTGLMEPATHMPPPPIERPVYYKFRDMEANA